MIKFSEHKEVMTARSAAIEVDEDRRKIMKACNTFVTDKDGQWEQNVKHLFEQYKRPRYTLDLCRPVVDSIYGELTQNEFNIAVKPMGNGASKDTAKVLAGLIKNTENLSNAVDVYNQVAKKAIVTGFSAFRIEQDWCDSDSFDQDLFFRVIHDAIDRVWFLGNFQSRTGEDADAVTVDHLVSTDEYEERFGGQPAQSLDDNQCRDIYHYKRQGIRISELIYKQKVSKTLYQLDGGVVLSEEDAKSSGADLKKAKIRKRDSYEVKVRFYDGNRFLSEPEDTVFGHLPVVPVLPNFEIVENKPLSNGAIEWLMDWQRIRNYAGSKKVEDVALLPRQRIMMTKKQGAGLEKQHATMNTSNRAIDFYNVDAEAPPPFIPGQVMPNPGANDLLMQSEAGINTSSGVYPAGLGDNPGLQSGVAIDKIQNKGDIGKLEYFNAMQVALSYAGKVSIHAYKKLMDTQQERRIIKDDGTYEMVTLNEVGLNGETINDLSKGVYDVVCDIGPAFRNRQEKTVDQIIAMAQYDPTLIPQGKDVLLNNIQSPGMELLAERARVSLMKMGEIPESQWTDDEKEAAAAAAQAAAQNPTPPDPNVMIGQAALKEAEAKIVKNEIETIKLTQNQQKMDFDQEKQKVELMSADRAQQMKFQTDTINMLKTMSEILKNLGESGEKDVSLSPDAQAAYDEQARDIQSVQQSM